MIMTDTNQKVRNESQSSLPAHILKIFAFFSDSFGLDKENTQQTNGSEVQC